MKISDKLLEFGNTYEEMRKEARSIIEEIKPKVKSISDAQTVNSLLQKSDFYWKHDLSAVKELAAKYKIKTSKMDNFLERYIKSEQDILKKRKDFEKLGIKNITFGPKSISASGEKESQISIRLDINSQKSEIYIYPENEDNWNKEFENFAAKLKKKIEDFLDGEF